MDLGFGLFLLYLDVSDLFQNIASYFKSSGVRKLHLFYFFIYSK